MSGIGWCCQNTISIDVSDGECVKSLRDLADIDIWYPAIPEYHR